MTKKPSRESQQARHGTQTLAHFPKTKPATSGARKKERPPPAYSHGFFLALVVEHNWPPDFCAGTYTSTHHLSAAATKSAEAGVGHAGHALNLPGATANKKVGAL
jgi:hypothetical protein